MNVAPAEQQTAPATAAPCPPRSRRRRLAVFFVRLAISIVLAVGLCEAILWVVAPEPFHEWLLWEPEGHILGRPVPGQEIDNAEGHKVRINKYGFRGADHAYDKQPGTLRIAVFGGSGAFDFKASSEEKTWPGALELKLERALGIPVEVLNLALPGLDTFTQKINYQCFGRAFHPDAIINYEMINDTSWLRTVETQPYTPQGVIPNRPWWQQIGRMTQIGRRARKALWAAKGIAWDQLSSQTEAAGSDSSRPIAEKSFAWFRQNYADLARLASADGVLPILCSQAFVGSSQNIDDRVMRTTIGPYCEQRGISVNRMIETWPQLAGIIKSVAEEFDGVYIDGYAAVPHDFDHLRDSVHLFDKGSEVLAEAMSKTLLASPQFMKLVERVRSEKQTTTH
jgi:hypothetical protein